MPKDNTKVLNYKVSAQFRCSKAVSVHDSSSSSLDLVCLGDSPLGSILTCVVSNQSLHVVGSQRLATQEMSQHKGQVGWRDDGESHEFGHGRDCI